MKAIDLDPKLANAWNNLGAVYYHLGNYSKAVEYYRKAIDLAPKDAVQWSNLGTAYNRLGNYDKGTECLYKAADCRGMVATFSSLLAKGFWRRADEWEKQEINREVKRNEDEFTAVQWNDKGMAACYHSKLSG